MSLARKLLGYREFCSEYEIRRRIERSKNFNANCESFENAKSLLIFQTTKQQTWLVSTDLRLYCVLDDRRKPEARLQWSEPKNQLMTDGSYAGSIIVRSKSEKTGLLDIGNKRRGWLFSKRLFYQAGIKESVVELLSD
jgi:hypothetical protein